MEHETFPGHGEKADLDRDERIFKAAVVDGALARELEWRAGDSEMRFWRGGFADEVDLTTWDVDGPFPIASPPSRSPSPGLVVEAEAHGLCTTGRPRTKGASVASSQVVRQASN